jgi:hypothetical protein
MFFYGDEATKKQAAILRRDRKRRRCDTACFYAHGARSGREGSFSRNRALPLLAGGRVVSDAAPHRAS